MAHPPPLPPEDELEQRIDDTFAQRLRLVRERHGWSQAQVAAWSGVSQQQISLYESGLQTPRVANLRALVVALRCSADWLLGLESPGVPVEEGG